MSVGERSRNGDDEPFRFLEADPGRGRRGRASSCSDSRPRSAWWCAASCRGCLRSRFDSLDFLQSVWGSFFRRMRTSPTEFEDSRHLVAFLARAAKNKVIDEYRRAASRKHDMHREEPLWVDGRRPKDVPDPIDSPSEIAQAHEVFGRLRELVPRRSGRSWK